MDINLAFTRLLLKGTMDVIKPLTTVAERKNVTKLLPAGLGESTEAYRALTMQA